MSRPTHPSVVELRHFVRSGEVDEAIVPHVSLCSSCRSALQRLARAELTSHGVVFEADEVIIDQRPRALAALLVVTVTMVMLSIVRPVVVRGFSFELASAEPEGLHGVVMASDAHRLPNDSWLDGGLSSPAE